MATTNYTVQQRISNSGDWAVTEKTYGKKGTAVAAAEKIHASDRFAVRIVTGAGTEVFTLRSRRHVVTRYTPAFTLTIPPVHDQLPETLSGYEWCYTRPRRHMSVLRNMEAPLEERYACVDDALEIIEFFATTRAAGAFMAAQKS